MSGKAKTWYKSLADTILYHTQLWISSDSYSYLKPVFGSANPMTATGRGIFNINTAPDFPVLLRFGPSFHD